MKSVLLGKYSLLIREYNMIPKEEYYKMPAELSMEYVGLFSLMSDPDDSSCELAHLVLRTDEKIYGCYEVMSFTNMAALYAFLTMTLSSKEKIVKIHKSRFTSTFANNLQAYWTVEEDSDYWYISLRVKPSIKAVIEDIERFLGNSKRGGIIQLVVGSKSYNAPATIETIRWFSDSLINQSKNGYVILNANLDNYGELIEFILGYEHSCVEVIRDTGEIRVWVVLAGPLLMNQRFPAENRRYTA